MLNRKFEGDIRRKTPTGGAASALIRAAAAQSAELYGTGGGQNQRVRRELQRRMRATATREADRKRTASASRKRRNGGSNKQEEQQPTANDADQAAPPAPALTRHGGGGDEDEECRRRSDRVTHRIDSQRRAADRFWRRHAADYASSPTAATPDAVEDVRHDAEVALHFCARPPVMTRDDGGAVCFSFVRRAPIESHCATLEEAQRRAPYAELSRGVRQFAVHPHLLTVCAGCARWMRTSDVARLEPSFPSWRAYHLNCTAADDDMASKR